jgi:hypothetical protein
MLVTAHYLAVDQAGAHLEVVDGLDNKRETVCPIITSPGQEPDADRIAPGHQPIAVVLDLVNPVRARRGIVGG